MADVQARVQALLDDLVGRDVERGLQVAAYLDGEWSSMPGRASRTRPRAGQWTARRSSPSSRARRASRHGHPPARRAGRARLRRPDRKILAGVRRARQGAASPSARRSRTRRASRSGPDRRGRIRLGRGCAAAIADLTPLWEPGTRTGYHAGPSAGSSARWHAASTGDRSTRIVAEDICRPLGITSLFFGIPDAVESRVAPLENDVSIDRRTRRATGFPDRAGDAGLKGFRHAFQSPRDPSRGASGGRRHHERPRAGPPLRGVDRRRR